MNKDEVALGIGVADATGELDSKNKERDDKASNKLYKDN